MLLPELVFIQHKDLKRTELILRTRPPYEVARAILFKSEQELDDYIIKHNLHGSHAAIPGYWIILCYLGTIENINEKIVLGHLVPGTALETLKKMGNFYLENRVKGNESRLKINKK